MTPSAPDPALAVRVTCLLLVCVPLQVFSTDRHPNSIGPCPDDPLDAGESIEGCGHGLAAGVV